MLARAIIPLTLLFAGAVIADPAHEARGLTTEVVIPVTDNGTTRSTTITSVYTAPFVPDTTDGIPTNTRTPIDTSTECYCYIPVTTTTVDIHTLTIHGPTVTTTTYTEFPLTTTICPCGLGLTNYVPVPTTDGSTTCYCYIPVTTTTADIHTLTIHGPAATTTTYTEFPLTSTICPCGLSPSNYVPVPTVDAGSIQTTQSAAVSVPTTQSVAAAAQETSGLDDNLFLNANGAVPRVTAVRWAGVATFFGFVGVGAMYL